LEKSSRLGGLIRTDVVEGCQLEAGPDSYIASKPAVTELAAQLGLSAEIIESNDTERRVYIVRENRFIEMPRGMAMMVPGDLNTALKSPLFSSATKLRFFSEIFFLRRYRTGDFSVQELVNDHFGPEILEYVTEPLLSGVYGGDSARLSAESVLPRFVNYERQYGSLIRGVRHERRSPSQGGSLFLSFRGGMQELTDTLTADIADSVDVVHQEATAVKPFADGWRVVCGAQQFTGTHLVIAAPARIAAILLGNSAPAIAAELSAIPYSSAILITLVYRKADASIPEGFGFLVPRTERQTIAATTFIGTKWKSRIPPDLVALRAFVVDPEAPGMLGLSDDELVQRVRADFRRLLHLMTKPIFSSVTRWPDSMPQYVVGHSEWMNRLNDILAGIPGLYLAGNSYSGVGVPDCVRLAEETAAKIAAQSAIN